jgi:HAD superfamily hydrolase (TIGR01490 family)
MKKKVAIFDIDGTIFRSSLLIELIQAMIGAGIFPASITKSYSKEYKAWLDRRGPYEKYINKVIFAFRREIKGVDYKKFAAVTKRVARFHQNRVYRFTRDLIQDLKKRGYYLLAISHSPKEAVQAFGKGLGFDKIYGTIGEEDSKRKFTGKVLYEDFIFDKAKVLERAVEKENLTLDGSVGVGDTESDIPFLKMVGRPICFNPNKKLYDYARRAGWEIVVERKDVIYKI